MNNKNTKPVIYDKTRLRTNRNKSNSYHQDSDSSAKSPNSTSSVSDERNCVFVRDSTGYGFKITGNAPVKVQAVRHNGSAWKSGLRENDIILKVNGESVIDKQHGDVVSLIRKQTKVELFVKNGDPIPSPNFASYPTRTSQISPPVLKKPRKEIEKSQQKLIKPPLKPLNISELSSSKNNLSPPIYSQGNMSDNSRISTESIGKFSDSHSDCSIGTSSTETDVHSHINYNKPKPNIPDMPESNTPPPKSKIVKPNIPDMPESNTPSPKSKIVKPNIPDISESNIPPAKPKVPKPLVLPKPNFPGSDYIQNRNISEQLQLSKLNDPPEKDSPVKSHSYNASSNKSSKLYDSKMNFEDPRNKTIPTDRMKSNNMNVAEVDQSNHSSFCNTFPRQLGSDHDNNEFLGFHKTYSTIPKKLAPNKPNSIQKSKSISNNDRILGRDFDDNQDDEDSDGSITIIDLLSHTKDAISRPGIVAVLLNNVNDQPTDLNAMMLYYACKYYRSIDLKKDSENNACRMANEIITSFLLEKSPMFVDVGLETVEDILKNLKSGENMKNIFDKMLKILLRLLENIVEKLKGRIQRGILLQTEFPKLGNEVNKDMEIGQLHRTVCNILNKISKNVDQSDYIIGKFIGLATIFQYFHKPAFSQGSSMRSRSTDGINTIGNQGKLLPIIDLYKCSIFCSAYQPKIFSSIRKKPKSISGHAVIDAVCLQPEDCGVCEGVLWGPSPQGSFCTVCQTFFHMNCKKKIKVPCSRKSRKSIIISGNKEEKPSTTIFGRLSRKSSTASVKNINSQSSIEVNSNAGSNIFNNNPLVLDEKTSHNTNDENTGISKAKSEDQLHRINNNMEPNGYMMNGSVNISMDNNNAGSVHITSTVQIQELVIDESNEDPDMKVDESFDAGGEINNYFPNLDPNADKKRLIVLLEFYHKTRYILMNLKRFLYKLVLKWPPSHTFYFKALSLDCIQPFVNLIKSLVTTIEGCIKEEDFVDLEGAVLNWLSDKKDQNLQEWINLSSNLCCTNSLFIVKQMKQTTMRTIPELNSLLNVKMHKMVIVEELTQIRPLLISLPLIVKNIIKCLAKSEPLYKDQLMIWSKVSIKMDYLCEYIDRCCVPLVDWINNGSIGKRIDRSEWCSRSKETENVDQDIINYCIDFPRTLFHFPIFDFQMAKIFSWSRNQKAKEKLNTDSRINYFKKGAEVLLIFYKSLIIVLPKENEHYILKLLKPFKNAAERIFPIIDKNAFMATNGGQEDDCYILNIISKKQEDASLIRVGFTRREFVENWLDYFSNDKHDLARSISLYKLNDIKDISNPNMSAENNNFNSNTITKLKATDSTYSTYSTISTTLSLTDTKDRVPDPEPEPELPPAPKEKMSAPTELVEGLAKASEIVASTNAHLCQFLNINEDHSDLLATKSKYTSSASELNAYLSVRDQGPKSLEEITLMFYSLCCPMIDLTRHLIISGSSQDTDTVKINQEDLKKTLFHISHQLKSIDFMKYTDEVDLSNDTTNDGKVLEYCPTFTPRETLNGNLSESETNSNEIVQEIKEIINEIVEKSIDQIQQEPYVDKSYKYIPEKCLVSGVRENLERSSYNLTPNYYHLTNPIEETITTTRAQIILNRSHNNNF